MDRGQAQRPNPPNTLAGTSWSMASLQILSFGDGSDRFPSPNAIFA